MVNGKTVEDDGIISSERKSRGRDEKEETV